MGKSKSHLHLQKKIKTLFYRKNCFRKFLKQIKIDGEQEEIIKRRNIGPGLFLGLLLVWFVPQNLHSYFLCRMKVNSIIQCHFKKKKVLFFSIKKKKKLIFFLSFKVLFFFYKKEKKKAIFL